MYHQVEHWKQVNGKRQQRRKPTELKSRDEPSLCEEDLNHLLSGGAQPVGMLSSLYLHSLFESNLAIMSSASCFAGA